MNLHFFKTIDGAVSGRLPKQTYLRYYSPFQNYLPLCIVCRNLCENTKNYKYAYPGSNKVVYGACEQESEEEEKNYF